MLDTFDEYDFMFNKPLLRKFLFNFGVFRLVTSLFKGENPPHHIEHMLNSSSTFDRELEAHDDDFEKG